MAFSLEPCTRMTTMGNAQVLDSGLSAPPLHQAHTFKLHKKQNKVHMNWISGTGTKQLLPLIYSGQNQLQNRVDRSDTAYMLLDTHLHKQTTC